MRILVFCRRQVEDVEKKLPPKIAVVVKVPLSALQSKVYEWVRATGEDLVAFVRRGAGPGQD